MGPERYERVIELCSRCLLLAVMDVILSQRIGVPRTFTSNSYYYGLLLYALWCLVNASVFLVVTVLILRPAKQLIDCLSFIALTVILGLSYAINEPLLQEGHVTGARRATEVKAAWLGDAAVVAVVQVALASVYVFLRGRVGWRASWPAGGRVWPVACFALFCLPAVLQLCGPPAMLLPAVGWWPTLSASLVHGELLLTLLLQIPCVIDSLEWQFRRLVQLLCNLRRLQLAVIGQWSRLRVPTVLGTYWLMKLAVDLALVVARERGLLAQQDDESESESGGLHPVVTFYDMDVTRDKVELYFRGPGTWANGSEAGDRARSAVGRLAWSTARCVLLRGCDGILPLLGMTTVVSAVARHIGRLLAAFLGADDGETGSGLGTMCGVLFFVLALQTGLTRLAPQRRLIRLARNLCLLGTAVLHFTHGLVHPMLLVTGASPTAPPARHARPLAVCALLLVASPIGLLVALWSWHAGANPWLLAVTVFSLEVLLKVTISLLTYGLLLYDARRQSTWERLDDYIYYLEAVGNGIEFLFGVFLFGNGTWILVFESQGGAGSLIRVCMMSIHAYYNIYWAACECWRALVRRRAASAKIDALPTASSEQLAQLDDICSICHGQLGSAVVTSCGHFFHGVCLRKWLYQHDRCPLCHQPVGGRIGMQQQQQQPQLQLQPEQQRQQQAEDQWPALDDAIHPHVD